MPETWTTLKAHPERFVDAGEAVAVLVRNAGRARTSGIGIDQNAVHVCSLRDGRIARIDAFVDVAAGYKAAGLEPI